MSNPITRVTAEEYLAIDRAAEFRSEFIDGEIIEKPVRASATPAFRSFLPSKSKQPCATVPAKHLARGIL